MKFFDCWKTLNECFDNGGLTAQAQLVGYKLLAIFNERMFPESLPITDRELMSRTNIKSGQTIVEARRQLKNAGLIDFETKKAQPTRYRFTINQATIKQDSSKIQASDNQDSSKIENSYIRAREDVKTLDVKTKKIKSAGAREETDPADILKVWKAETGYDLRGDRQRWDLWDKADKNFALTQQAILKAMNTKKTFVLTYEHFQNTYNELQNPVSLKGGDKNARQFDYSEEPDTSWIKPYS